MICADLQQLRRVGSLACSLTILGLAAAGARAAEFVVVADGVAPPPVCYLKTSDRRDRDMRSAQSLASYLKRISGGAFSAKAVDAAPAGRAILVGKICGKLPEDPGGDGFLIKITKDQLWIAGATPRGTAIGVYAFLEEQLGCRWWSHNEEDVPTRTEIRLPVMQELVKPVFWQTDLMNKEAKSRSNDFEFKGRGVSTEVFVGGHTLYKYLTPYAQKNNEFYPYNPGKKKRGPNKLHFCYTAPGIAEALAEALEVQVKKRNGNIRDFLYQAGMGDWYGGLCECKRCQAVYGEERWTRPDGVVRPAGSSTLIRMMNKTGAILEKKHPGVRVSTFAYMSIEGPPGKTVPGDNVAIWLPHLRHCIIHGADRCSANYNYLENLKQWCKLAPGRVYIWDYAVNYGENFLYPFPVIRSMGENIKLYAKLGVRGVRLQGNYVSTGGDLAVLKNWVWSKLLWNPDLKVDDLIREFCQGYYGPAADELAEYVLSLEDLAESSPVHMNEFGKLGHMRRTYLGFNPYDRLKILLGKRPDRTYGKEVAAMLMPLLSDKMKDVKAAMWNAGIDPILAQDITGTCGKELANSLRKEFRNRTRSVADGKSGAAVLKRILTKRAKTRYGQAVLDLLAPLSSAQMQDASGEAWKKKLATLQGSELERACAKHRAEGLRGILKTTKRNAAVWENAKKRPLLFERALKKVGENEPFRRRVLEARVSIEAAELWHTGPIIEKDGELVRVDLGEEPTWRRALAMLENSRKASAREWGPYRGYHLSLMNMHGGPLVTLKKDKLVVKVTPWLHGRIRQIEFNGQELLRIPGPKEKGYPGLGGCYEQVVQGYKAGRLAGEPTERRVEILGDGGGGSTIKHKVRKVVEILDDGAIRITAATRQNIVRKGIEIARGTSVTEYVVGAGDDTFGIDALVRNKWQRIAVAKPSPEAIADAKKQKRPLPEGARLADLPEGVRALLITLPGRGCVIEDSYLSPSIVSGRVLYDGKAGVLTTTMTGQNVKVNLKTETQWLHREIRIRARGKAGKGSARARHRIEARFVAESAEDENLVRPDLDREKDLEKLNR